MSTSSSPYIMGYTDHERRRLSLQATILNPLTEQLLKDAGLRAGMRILDLGCGIGDVSFVAARLVGPDGNVTGIDIDTASLEIARTRAEEKKQRHVVFKRIDFAQEDFGDGYDAVVGRHVLIHLAEPAAIIRKAASVLQSGGVLAFQEYDFLSWPSSYPEIPLMNRIQNHFVELFKRATPHPNVGIRLFHLMTQAGLQQPKCRMECLVDGGPDSPFYEWFSETVRSVAPKLEALGLVTAAELDLDTLTGRIREQALSLQACVPAAPVGSAFAYKP